MTNNTENPGNVENHKGSLFFPLPDGSAILYNLVGKSNAPLPVSTVDLNVIARKTHVHVIEVKNWLRDLQRFDVNWSLETPEPSLFISGAKTIDIGGDS